jgi:hypothetical protein
MPFRFQPAAALAAVVLFAAPAAAQSSRSASLAPALVGALERQNLQNVAARDPERPGFYVAASRAPGMLLVVSGRSIAPDYVDYVLAASKYDEVYASLNGASAPEGKLFVQDMGADGLSPKPEEGRSTDIVYRDVTTTTILDGQPKKRGLSEREYEEAFEAIDQKYSEALSLLLRQLEGGAVH